MPVCHRCGKVNAKDSLFCQECGTRLAAATEPTPPVAVHPDGPPVCGRCNTVNEPGMSFCKMCGAPLGPSSTDAIPPSEEPAPAPVATPAATPTASVRCASCGRAVVAGLAFCQHCGTRVATPAKEPDADTPAAKLDKPEQPQRPHKQEKQERHKGAAREPARSEPARGAETEKVDAAPPATEAGPPAASVEPEPERKPDPALFATQPARVEPKPAARAEPRRAAAPARGRIVIVRDGRDHETHPIVGETFDVGRSDGQLILADDPHLAPRHARFTVAGTTVKVRPLDGLNGVYVRVREAQDLSPGDMLLIGHQVLRFENVGPEEREPHALAEHGVRLLGSTVKEAWGRLRQITTAGTTRDVWHLTGTEVTIGKGGDIALSDDDQMSSRHVVLRRQGGRPRIEDHGTAARTFVRLRSDRELRNGDLLRIGEQLVRFESAG